MDLQIYTCLLLVSNKIKYQFIIGPIIGFELPTIFITLQFAGARATNSEVIVVFVCIKMYNKYLFI